MALESATHISDLVVTNPTGSDPLAFADDHLRLIKSSIKNTFPNISGAVTKTQAQINDGLEKAGGTMTGTLILSGAPTVDLQASTKAYVDAAIAATKLSLYPVGSIYVNATNATNPATLLGFGTWVAFGEGRVLVGQSSSDTLFDVLEETGGSKDAIAVSHTHTGTIDSNGAHTHTINPSVLFNQDNDPGSPINTITGSSSNGTNGPSASLAALNYLTTNGAHTHTLTIASSGSSGTNANLQPHIVVKMWKRTA